MTSSTTAGTAALASMTVNDLLRLAPAAAAVLNRFGIDTCCGGGLTLEQAAGSVGLALPALVAALPPLAAQPTTPSAAEGA